MNVTVTIDAVEPMELMRDWTPDGVWMRQEATERGVTEVSIQGPREDVIDFLMHQWGHTRSEAIGYVDLENHSPPLDCVECGLPIKSGPIKDAEEPRHIECHKQRQAIFRVFELTMTVYLPRSADLPVTFGDWVERAFGVDQRTLGASATTLNRVAELRYPLAPDVVERRRDLKEPVYS